MAGEEITGGEGVTPPTMNERMASAMAAMDAMGGDGEDTTSQGDVSLDSAGREQSGGEPGSLAESDKTEGDADGSDVAPDADAKPAEGGELDDLESIARAAHERRMAAQQESTETKAKSEREASLDAREAELNAMVALMESDPVAYLEKHRHKVGPVYEKLTKLALDSDKVNVQDTAKSALEEARLVREELRSYREEVERREQSASQQKQHQAARESFASASADKDAYPLLARLSKEERVDRGVKAATHLEALAEDARRRGEDDSPYRYDDARIAKLVEGNLKKTFQAAWADLGSSSGKSDAVAGDQTKRKPSSDGPQTISSQLASESAGTPKPTTPAERMKNAIAMAERLSQ